MSKNETTSASKILASLNDLTNLHMIVRKKDGERRKVGHNNGDLGDALADCSTPSDIGKVAMENGIRLEEIVERAKNAPNFGQFRMVIGNRLAAIVRRVDGGMSIEEAAYPKEAAKAKREAARLAKAQGKTKADKQPTKKGKNVKKVTKKGMKKIVRKGIKMADGDAPTPASLPVDPSAAPEVA